jgi:molybdopterin-containing oxidoreductase family iron-sulfur binding subunit
MRDAGNCRDRGGPSPAEAKPLDLESVRARLGELGGRSYWRGLEELAGTEGFREFLHREFPRQASEWTDTVSRRQFLNIMGASLALAGLSACTRNPVEKIVPFVKAPEGIVPGKPLFYATALTQGGVATGVLVESQMGRPIKIEGNDLHPASLGATDARMQASILSLYDPDRSQVLKHLGDVRPWSSFLAALRDAMTAQKAGNGRGLRILTETVTSPTLAGQLDQVLAEMPEARWHQYEPVNRDSARQASRWAFGEDVDVHFDLSPARVILSLDADFLFAGAGSLKYIRDFTAGRRVSDAGHGGHEGHGGGSEMNRLYMVESSFTSTGAKADHRLALSSREIEDFTRSLAANLGIAVSPGSPGGRVSAWAAAVAKDLKAHPGHTAIIPGDAQPPAVHLLALAMNQALGNIGRTVFVTDPVEARPVIQGESIAELVRDMAARKVELLVILGGNPVYNAPADLRFGENLDMVGLRVHLSPYVDETSVRCHWHVPETHSLEMWSDARAFDGTASVIQPLIAPLYEGKSAHEIVAALSGQSDRTAHDAVREQWKKTVNVADFEAWWRRTLHDGVVENTAFPARDVPPVRLDRLPMEGGRGAAGIEIILRPDPSIHDGRFANNGWLQELPKPLTQLTWDNAALVSPALAQKLGLQNEEMVEVTAGGSKITLAAWILPGLPGDSVTIHLGYGRTRAGRVGNGAGADAYLLRTSRQEWAGPAELKRTGRRGSLACTQLHHSMEGRHLIRSASLAEHNRNPHWAHELAHEPDPSLTMYPPFEYNGNAWGMAVDLTACVGCNACVTACQAENNIPVVGKSQVMNGREMHWIRIDRYFEGGLDQPQVLQQPVMCQHCENAPCEVVCPVQATVHNHEGLNDMIYNRCVGTRYCANNCPYKVRRFNFLQYSDQETASLRLLANPDVTVRTRGVMEKCSYCVQRINVARIEARKEDRPLSDGEIATACQQACPAGAIVFGDVNDPRSRVARLKASALNYGILADLNTRPRTTYLAEIRNPNPELEAMG